ncbi:MAG: hypothetical protein ACXVCV_06325 [Polyangia bacterium]
MLALGVSLLVTVAATPPPAAHAVEKLASTYDEASCDPSEGGECAEEQLIDFDVPQLAGILDCESPIIQEMIGSCDLPKPTIPSLHLPTVRNGGNSFSVATNGSSEHLSVVATAASLDAAMTFHSISLAPPPFATRLDSSHQTSTQDAPRSRLDRPPRV